MSTSTSRRRRRTSYHHGDLSAAVLAAAGDLLEKQGLAGVSVRELARRARVSHNAPYRHFPDRESLLAALAAEGFALLGEAQRAAAEAGDLRGMGAAYVRFALEHPQRFRLMFSGQLAIERHAGLRQIAGRAYEALSGALAQRVPGAEGARDASIAAWALVHGLAMLLLEERVAQGALRGRERDAFVRDVLSAVRFVARQSQPA